jgi:thiol:disulfide interchange protein
VLRSRLSFLAALLLVGSLPLSMAATPTLSGYDPKANPDADLRRALVEAKAGNKKVLVVAGGEWCTWCHYLEAFLKNNPAIDAELHRAFVPLKVYIGEENKNTAFFSRLPPAKGYPHFWVIASDGKVQKSVNTGTLEDGRKSYDKKKFLKFIQDLAR